MLDDTQTTARARGVSPMSHTPRASAIRLCLAACVAGARVARKRHAATQIARTLAVALVLVLTATGLWAAGDSDSDDSAAADKEMVLDPSTGKMVTAPEYGGTLTWPTTVFPPSADNWWNLGWAMQPPINHGALAESWSMPDDTTFIWHIRQGVHWHDKEPMNGRELDAHDIVWNYHRYLGFGDFSEDGPNAAVHLINMGAPIESVTATDKWTVEIKLAKPTYDMLGKMLRSYFYVHAPEQVERDGDAKDWRNTVGTGPLQLVEFVEGSSATWEKNPNYWGYDGFDFHVSSLPPIPQNRLPYIDTYRALLVTEGAGLLKAGRLAAAEAVFRSVLEFHPTSAVARYSLATIHYARGEHAQATAELLKVIELYPGNVDARYSLAIVHSMLGEHDQAELQLQEVLRLAPDHQRARTALQNLNDTGR